MLSVMILAEMDPLEQVASLTAACGTGQGCTSPPAAAPIPASAGTVTRANLMLGRQAACGGLWIQVRESGW